MATYSQNGKVWRVQACVKGVRGSATRPTKREAVQWAAQFALDVENRLAGIVPDVPFSVVLERYQQQVSPKKRTGAREVKRIDCFLRDSLASVPLSQLSAVHFSDWRDRRLRNVSAGSVIREWSLMSHILAVAMKEWRMIKENPLDGVARPKSPLPRDRRISDAEIQAILYACGYEYDGTMQTITARVGVAFLFAIETAMRAGEICALKWSALSGVVAYLPVTKNGFPRHVPLSSEALRLISQCPKDTDYVFGINSAQLDALFRKMRGRAMVKDLHFHDTRHEAITRLASRLNVLELARMVGIRDLKILMVYYNARPEDLAARLG